MGLLGFKGMRRFVLFMLVLMAGLGDGKVVLIGKDVTLSFDDVEANFSPVIKGSAECGVLYVVEPVDACTPLKVKVDEGIDPAFALIIRGGCTFDDKVRNAQEAGFKAAIVYNNEHGPLVAMAGTSGHTHIHAVFVSKDSGEALKRHAGRRDIELWIIPTFESSAWSIMAISFISLLAMFAALATCFFVHRHSIRRRQHRDNIREFHGMSSQLVKALPSLRFTSVLEDNSTSATCAICLEDYNFGEKLRILPCLHKFHANCVDIWLTTRRTFCPICKRDARTSTGNLPPSECTPLLSSGASTPNSSFYSSIGIPSALQIPTTLQINPIPPPLPFTNRSHSLSSSIPRVPNPRRSSGHSPPINISRSSMDFRSASYPSSYASSSLGLPRSSPRYSRFMPSYFRSSNNASTSYITGSRSMPAMDSAQSLPEC